MILYLKIWIEIDIIRDLEIYAESFGAKLYHYQDYDGGEIDAVLAAAALVALTAKFVRHPPRSLAVVVGKSGIAYRRKEDGVYVLPITALKA